MSKEKDFHKLIEQQCPEEKEAAWRRLESKLTEQQALGEQRKAPSPREKSLPKFIKILSACASFVVIAIIGLGVGLGIGLNPDKGGGDDALGKEPPEQTTPVEPDTSNEPAQPEIVIRYCGSDDCEIISGELTLKQYAETYQTDLLYLDWYEETGDYSNYIYRLKENGDSICFQEDFMIFDGVNEGNYISLFVTDNKTETDFLTWHSAETGKEAVINHVSVYYMCEGGNTLANFEYKGYKYYLEVLSLEVEGYILEVAELMLQHV